MMCQLNVDFICLFTKHILTIESFLNLIVIDRTFNSNNRFMNNIELHISVSTYWIINVYKWASKKRTDDDAPQYKILLLFVHWFIDELVKRTAFVNWYTKSGVKHKDLYRLLLVSLYCWVWIYNLCGVICLRSLTFIILQHGIVNILKYYIFWI